MQTRRALAVAVPIAVPMTVADRQEADARGHPHLQCRAFDIDNVNNRSYWNFHPYPQRIWFAELRADL